MPMDPYDKAVEVGARIVGDVWNIFPWIGERIGAGFDNLIGYEPEPGRGPRAPRSGGGRRRRRRGPPRPPPCPEGMTGPHLDASGVPWCFWPEEGPPPGFVPPRRRRPPRDVPPPPGATPCPDGMTGPHFDADGVPWCFWPEQGPPPGFVPPGGAVPPQDVPPPPGGAVCPDGQVGPYYDNAGNWWCFFPDEEVPPDLAPIGAPPSDVDPEGEGVGCGVGEQEVTINGVVHCFKDEEVERRVVRTTYPGKKLPSGQITPNQRKAVDEAATYQILWDSARQQRTGQGPSPMSQMSFHDH